jgi:ABC-type polysaccharide/polyol phosphate export permease
MAIVIEGFRQAVIGEPSVAAVDLIATVAIVCVSLVAALFFFRRMDRFFADVV